MLILSIRLSELCREETISKAVIPCLPVRIFFYKREIFAENRKVIHPFNLKRSNSSYDLSFCSDSPTFSSNIYHSQSRPTMAIRALPLLLLGLLLALTCIQTVVATPKVRYSSTCQDQCQRNFELCKSRCNAGYCYAVCGRVVYNCYDSC